ncbi:hypothetical protein [Sphingopyxis sp.]|jgi:hypothetical protein|uniref:hypothetical protein n=1 Tax=Sphingopyxis sp. TaxID=1908224 RepID=UPI0025F5B59D|nr:hypothetical protein [Sphingopyxis sp.]MBK6412016.1 hypothetical protein [Sphingopyxis sp.]
MNLVQSRSTIGACALALAVLSALPATAKDKDAPTTPAQIQQLYDCRAIPDAAARLACFDRQVAALEQAQTANDITFFDRNSAQKARRGLFGFTLRDLPFFGGGDDDREKMSRLESTIKWARREGFNKMRFEIEDGAIWLQTDQTDLPRDPKAGEKVVITPGAVGSYFAEIGSLKRIRVRRER